MSGESWVDIRDEVVSIFGLLQPTKGHLGARNVLFGVFEVFKLFHFVLANNLWTDNVENPFAGVQLEHSPK
jgi:hypothetical protein